MENLEGLKEYLDMLEAIGDDKVLQKILKAANRESLKSASKALKSLPYPKSVKKIGIRAAKVDGNRHPNAMIVGPTSDAFKLRWLDKGTAERYTKTGAYRGKLVGTNKVESLINSEAKKVQDNVVELYGEGLVKATSKYVKKINKNK